MFSCPRLVAVESDDLGDSRGAEKRVSNTRFLPSLCQLHVYVKYEIYSVRTILSDHTTSNGDHVVRNFTVSGGVCALDWHHEVTLTLRSFTYVCWRTDAWELRVVSMLVTFHHDDRSSTAKLWSSASMKSRSVLKSPLVKMYTSPTLTTSISCEIFSLVCCEVFQRQFKWDEWNLH